MNQSIFFSSHTSIYTLTERACICPLKATHLERLNVPDFDHGHPGALQTAALVALATLVNFTCANVNSVISSHPEGAGSEILTRWGPKCTSRLNLLNAGWSGSGLMSVYARSQEVVITGDGGVTQGNPVSRCRWRAGGAGITKCAV